MINILQEITIDSSTIWYRGSNRNSHTTISFEGGNDNQQYGPGLYFTTDYETAKHYGSVKAFKINTKERFMKESSRLSPYQGSIDRFFSRLPQRVREDALSNWDEDPIRAKRELFSNFYQSNDNMVEALQSMWSDFCNLDSKLFLEICQHVSYTERGKELTTPRTSAPIIFNGLIVKEDSGKQMWCVLYNVKLAREIDIPTNIMGE